VSFPHKRESRIQNPTMITHFLDSPKPEQGALILIRTVAREERSVFREPPFSAQGLSGTNTALGRNTPALSVCRLCSTIGLKQLAKLFDGEPSIADETVEGKCVDGVMARGGQDARAAGHNDVLAFADHRKAGLFESADNIEMIDARNLGQG
jgi:hypothetical protein